MSEQIMETIVKFNEQRFQLEQAGKFIEAGRVKQKLTQLGLEYVKVRLEELKVKQSEEKNEFDKQYETELEEVQQAWDQNLEEKEKEIQSRLEELQGLQSEAFQREEARLREKENTEGKPTPEMLNAAYQIQQLVNKQRYDEAAVLQKRLEALRVKAIQKNGSNSDSKIKNALERILKSQVIELNSAEAKLLSEREAIISAREKSLNAVHSKYKVIHDKLIKSHTAEAINHERAFKNFNASSNQLIMTAEQE